EGSETVLRFPAGPVNLHPRLDGDASSGDGESGGAGGSALGTTPERVLFIRGADRSGGFLEAGNDEDRTEQLADINNFNTNGGNHGWGTFADTLRDHGYDVTQITETVETGAPPTGPTEGVHVDLETLDLLQYEVVVFGSNNATYDQAALDAYEDYVRRGGATLFISDANFGGNWGDAPTSDQPFLDLVGWTMNQDQGTYALNRSSGDFVVPDHPILAGIDSFDGEGVSPVNLAGATTGQRLTIAKGNTRNNDAVGAGSSRPVNDGDASLAVANLDGGRIAAHFDRNTFFNQNGAGTNINRLDNAQYARNLFDWLAGRIGDTRAPTAAATAETDARQAVVVNFDEDVAGSLEADDLQLRNLTTGQTIDSTRFSLAVEEFGRRAVFEYDVATFGSLPDGNYEATLTGGSASDAAGNVLTGDVTAEFFVLAGDANGDRNVDLQDFLILRENFNTGSLFSEADFNYDGSVNLDDFLILRDNFNTSLPPA
ncbi:MAG: dockerin type I domain-containing protein, partial [Planctomycetota bacterium]